MTLLKCHCQVFVSYSTYIDTHYGALYTINAPFSRDHLVLIHAFHTHFDLSAWVHGTHPTLDFDAGDEAADVRGCTM